MKNKILENMDTPPKRRKDKYNPYKLFSVGKDTDTPKYYISFTDSSGEDIFIEIGKEIFDAFDRFELDDLSYLHKVSRHYEHFELTEESLNQRATKVQESVDEIVTRRIEEEKLHEAISKLPDLQRRRLVLYYFYDMKLKDIAELEGCKYQPIQKSIERAKSKIKEFLD
jgi:RNA polymerase sigma-70 factor (ECF subfamily)